LFYVVFCWREIDEVQGAHRGRGQETNRSAVQCVFTMSYANKDENVKARQHARAMRFPV